MSLALLLLAPVASAADDSVMRPWGQLQVFTTVVDQDTDAQAEPASYGDPEADPGFAVARARFGFFGNLPQRGTGPIIDYGLSLGINTPYDALQFSTQNVGMVDAFGRITFEPSLGTSRISLGLVKVPFSREASMSSQDLVFMERSVGTEYIASVRDIGVLAEQDLDLGESSLLRLSLGLFNGNNDFLGDNDPGLLYAGRLEYVHGDLLRTWNPKRVTEYGVGGSIQLNDELATRSLAMAGDGFLRVANLTLMAELATRSITPTNTDITAPNVFAKTNRSAWTGAVSYWIPFADVDTDVPGLELAVRASSYDDNTALDDNGGVLVVHVGGTVRSPVPMFDIGAGFIHREELGGRSLPNDTVRLWAQLRPRQR